jgi:hypothetical protein
MLQVGATGIEGGEEEEEEVKSCMVTESSVQILCETFSKMHNQTHGAS